jgi:hypothetical protein
MPATTTLEAATVHWARQFRDTHPRSEWERGYIPSGAQLPQSRQLRTAYRNRTTGQVDYLIGSRTRLAGPQLTARFHGMRYQ